MSKYKRILIIGSAGSGKTYLSNILSKKLDIDVTHLDKIYWLPNWEKQPVTFCEDLTKELVVSNEWILDGNYIQTLDIRLFFLENTLNKHNLKIKRLNTTYSLITLLPYYLRTTFNLKNCYMR